MGARGMGRAVALASGLWLALAAAEPAAAQYSIRLQAPWVHDHVAGVVIGLETREPIGRVPPQPAEGPRIIATRDWMFTGMGAVGVNFDSSPDDRSHVLIQAHAGVLRRLSGDLEPRVGVVGVLFLPVGLVGPAARVELMDVAVVQAGWMFDAGAHIALEVAARFVCDLVAVGC